MKLFSICTAPTAVLRDEWFLKTLQDDWEVHICDLDDVPQGNGDYLSREWYHCIRKKIDILHEAIRANPDEIIIWADIDMQFFRPCTDSIKKNMQDMDIMFQRWLPSKPSINTGFMAIRCNTDTRAFFETVATTPFEHRTFADQDAVNDLLASGNPPVRWGMFDPDIYQINLGLPPATIALHHACSTPGPGIRNGRFVSSMEHKIEQLTMIRRYVESPWWRKLLFRIRM
jgi:hypothetical protein